MYASRKIVYEAKYEPSSYLRHSQGHMDCEGAKFPCYKTTGPREDAVIKKNTQPPRNARRLLVCVIQRNSNDRLK